MDHRRIKAYGFHASVRFVEAAYDAAAQRRILDGLSAEARSFVALADKIQWAPPGYSAQLWAAIVKEHGSEATGQLVRVGRYQGSFATHGYLRALAQMLTMKSFAWRIPDLWARDANFGRVLVESLQKGGLRLRFQELGGFPYFGPVTEGWLQATFEEMGARGVLVQLKGWSLEDPDPPELVYQIEWRL